jgi:hypothetical protein
VKYICLGYIEGVTSGHVVACSLATMRLHPSICPGASNPGFNMAIRSVQSGNEIMIIEGRRVHRATIQTAHRHGSRRCHAAKTPSLSTSWNERGCRMRRVVSACMAAQRASEELPS